MVMLALAVAGFGWSAIVIAFQEFIWVQPGTIFINLPDLQYIRFFLLFMYCSNFDRLLWPGIGIWDIFALCRKHNFPNDMATQGVISGVFNAFGSFRVCVSLAITCTVDTLTLHIW